MTVSAILWDLGGTIVERHMSERDVGIRALLAARINPLRLRPESIERSRQYRLEALLRWRSLDEEAAGFRQMASLMLAGLTPAATADQVQTIASIFAAYDPVYRVIPGMRQLLGEMRSRGVRQALVSNWPPSLPRFLRHHSLDGFFEVVVGSGAEGVVKPDPELLRQALRRLGVSAPAAVCVGDDLALDIVPARSLGLRAVHFNPLGGAPDADAHDPSVLRNLLLALLEAA